MTLKELRKRDNLTQRQLAKKLQISVSSIAMYETGERIPQLRKAKAIADFFGVQVESIFFSNNAHEMRA